MYLWPTADDFTRRRAWIRGGPEPLLAGQGEEPDTLLLGWHDDAETAAILPVICLAGGA